MEKTDKSKSANSTTISDFETFRTGHAGEMSFNAAAALQLCMEKIHKNEAELKKVKRRLEELERIPEGNRAAASFHKQLANKIGIIGLQEIARSKHVGVKFLWLFLLLCGIAATVYFTYKTAAEYLDDPTATKVKVNVSDFYDLPAVAICPAPWVDTEKALSLGITLDAFKYLLGYISTWKEIQIRDVPKARAEFLKFYKSRNFSSLIDYYKAISIDMETLYSTKDFSNASMAVRLSDRNSSLIDKIFLHYQTCYAYSFRAFGRSLSATTYAAVKFSDKTKGIVKFLPDLWIHLKTDQDLVLSPLSALYARASYRSKILVSAQRLVTLRTPENACAIPQSDENYSETACASKCQNRHYREKIKCKIFRYSLVSDAPSPLDTCNFMEKLTSVQNMTYSEFASSDENNRITNECSRSCPLKCDRVVYQMRMQWEQKLVEDTAPTNLTKNRKSETSSYFEIYVEHEAKYDGTTLEFFEVSTYSFTTLFGNVGGTFGLFIGATVMTFAQLVIFFVEHFFRRVDNRGKAVV